MSSPKNNTEPDLDRVIAAAGGQIFSFLPIGSLLSASSPLLINTTFHDGVFRHLGQTVHLTLSQCPHLRGVTDDQLSALIEKIVRIGGASAPRGRSATGRRRSRDASDGATHRPRAIKAQRVDLSRCRRLTGEGVLSCLRRAPAVERLSLSSASRFRVADAFAELELRALRHVDLAGCQRVDSVGLNRFVGIPPNASCSSIRHLDLSGVSTQINDDICNSLIFLSNALESLSLAGSKKVTSSGVGLIAYLCRDTLRCLNLRSCELVDLTRMLMADTFDVVDLVLPTVNGNHRLMVPPNFVGDPDALSANGFTKALVTSTVEVIRAHSNEDIVNASRQLLSACKTTEQSLLNRTGWNQRRGERMFAQLEQLDIAMIGNRSIRLDGMVAIIAWLAGGRLRQVDLSGLNNILPSDLCVLACVSSPTLSSLSAMSTLTTPFPLTIAPPSIKFHFFRAMENISELDLSCCTNMDFRDAGDGAILAILTTLRSLKLDYTEIHGHTVQAVLAGCAKLLRLSVRGCSNLAGYDLHSGERQLGLLDVDCRDIQQMRLSKLREVCPHLLRLNSRCTALGAKKLKAHRSSFLWRVGSPAVTKSSMDNKSGATTSDNTVYHDYSPIFTNHCSILGTGFSQSKDTEQEMFACKTCSINGFGRFICITCVKLCHQGHDVSSSGFGRGYCDCAIFSLCKCLNREGSFS